MKYVLDVSVALKWVLAETQSVQALALREEFQKGIHDLLVPDIFLAELSNSLTKAERRKIIAQHESRNFLADILATWPHEVSYFPLSPRALEISCQTRSSFYDCLYVALAEREACELVTADQRLINNLQAQYPFIIPLSAVP